MTSRFNELYAAEIRKFRDAYIKTIATAVLDAGGKADVVKGAAYLAGLQWDETHPSLLADIKEMTS